MNILHNLASKKRRNIRSHMVLYPHVEGIKYDINRLNEKKQNP